MKPLMLVGALLAAGGILGLAFTSGIHYKIREKFPADGAAQVTVKQERILSIPPVASGLALAAGIALMIVAARK